jgi:hypothetical protein
VKLHSTHELAVFLKLMAEQHKKPIKEKPRTSNSETPP